MDPLTFLAVLDSSTGLIGKCLTLVKDLNHFAAQYKLAELTVISMTQELDMMRLAWEQIETRISNCDGEAIEPEIIQRIDRSLKCGMIVMSALEKDLLDYKKTAKGFGSRQRLKSIWNSQNLQDHLSRIRGQAQSMSLLLTVVHLPELAKRKQLLSQGAALLRRTDESAYSIVPSRMSLITQDQLSRTSFESAEMSYRELQVDNDIFTSRVYKRNYRTPAMTIPKEQQKPADQETLMLNDGTGGHGFLKKTTSTVATSAYAQRHVAHMMVLQQQGCVLTAPPRESSSTKPPSYQLSYSSNELDADHIQTHVSPNERYELADNVAESTTTMCSSSRASESLGSSLYAYRGRLNDLILETEWVVESTASQYRYAGSNMTSKTSILKGPAVAIDLCGAPIVTSLIMTKSVACCKAEDLKTLLSLLDQRFMEWRMSYFLEAFRQDRTPLLQVFLESTERITGSVRCSDAEEIYVRSMESIATWAAGTFINVVERYCLLHMAIARNHTGVLAFLIKFQAKVDYSDSQGVRPIHLACSLGNVECVRLLIAAGAQIDCGTPQGYKPIHYLGLRESVDNGDAATILDALLVAGVSIDTTTDQGRTLLQLACQYHKISVLKAALLFGACPTPPHATVTPLEAACQESDNETLQVLLRYHRIADVCAIGTLGESPLSLAIRYEHGTTVQKLINKAYDLEVQWHDFLGPIYLACAEHELPITDWLKKRKGAIIIGDLLTFGPLFSPRKSSKYVRPSPDEVSVWPA